MTREVALVRCFDVGRGECCLRALEVDVSVAGESDDNELARTVWIDQGEHNVLESVGSSPRLAVRARMISVRHLDEGLDSGRVRSIEDLGRGKSVE